MILRDTLADWSNMDAARENARAQTRVEVNWENFDRYLERQHPRRRRPEGLLGRAHPALRRRLRPGRGGRERGGGALPPRGAQLVLPAQRRRLRPQARAAHVDLPDPGHRRAGGLGDAGGVLGDIASCCRTPSWWSSRIRPLTRRSRRPSCSRQTCATSSRAPWHEERCSRCRLPHARSTPLTDRSSPRSRRTVGPAGPRSPRSAARRCPRSREGPEPARVAGAAGRCQQQHQLPGRDRPLHAADRLPRGLTGRGGQGADPRTDLRFLCLVTGGGGTCSPSFCVAGPTRCTSAGSTRSSRSTGSRVRERFGAARL